jgi:hypothetical protein
MRSGVRAAAVSVLASVFLFGSIRSASPIALDNDSEILSSASGPIGFRCVVCRLEIVGAPRLVEAADAASVGRIKIALDVRGNDAPASLSINVNVYEADTLRPVLNDGGTPFQLQGPVCPMSSDPFCKNPFHGKISLSQFDGFQSLEFLQRTFGRDVILTIALSVRFASSATSPAIELTVSGAGDEILVDRIGDSGVKTPGHALDVPPRSMVVVDALGRLAAGARQQTGVELDVSGLNRPVGLTHAFNLRHGAIIDRATLTLHIEPGGGGFNNDYVFLDDGVSILAADGPRGAPRTFIRDLPGFVRGEASAVELDLSTLLSDLYDGQLNVIVSDDSVVNFSELRIFLREP